MSGQELQDMAQWGVAAVGSKDTNDESNGNADEGGGGSWSSKIYDGLVASLPKQYFHTRVRRDPVAPIPSLTKFLCIEIGLSSFAFAIMCWFFNSNVVKQINISLTPLANQVCTVLNPKKGTAYYSDTDSENAQFASPYLSKEECISFMTKKGVCEDGKRFDHLSVLGVSNANNSQYYSSNFYSFTPSQTAGVTTKLESLYGTSIAFPQPSVTQTFAGSSTNWYVFDFMKNTASDAFKAFPGVAVSSLLCDPSTNKVYDPYAGMNQDFDLSSSSNPPTAISTNKIVSLRAALGLSGYLVSDIGIFNGVYYGIAVAQSTFNEPYGVAVASQGSNGNFYVFVAENGNPSDGKLDQVYTDIGEKTSSSEFSFRGVAATSDGTKVFASTSTSQVYGPLTSVAGAVSGGTVSGTALGSGSDFNSPMGLACDQTGTYVMIADKDHDDVKKVVVASPSTTISLSSTCTSCKFDHPSSVALDTAGNVYVADTNNNAIKMIDHSTYTNVTLLGTSAVPAFNFPQGVAVNGAGTIVYVADTGNQLVRKIDLSGGVNGAVVTNLGTTADPPFNSPRSIAVDTSGNVYVADTDNNLVRMISASTGELSTRVGVMIQPKLFSYDTNSAGGWSPTSSQIPASLKWQSKMYYENGYPLGPIDTSDGGCKSLETFYKSGNPSSLYPTCYLMVHSERNAETSLLYLEFVVYVYVSLTIKVDITRIVILDPTTSNSPSTVPITFKIPAASSTGSRQLWGVFKATAAGSTAKSAVLFTSSGAYSNTPGTQTQPVGVLLSAFANYNALVTATGTTVVDGSRIPSSSSSSSSSTSPRYLLLMLNQKGYMSTYTYDTQTDTFFSNTAAAATTNYMIAYTYGICDGNVTRGLVEHTFSNDYSNQCQLPSTGMYYQSKNIYYSIPYACLGIAYDKLLTDCAEIKANMKALVDDTCTASINKVCDTQYTQNPPFACVQNIAPTPLTVISLAGSNTMALASMLATLMAIFLMRTYKNYTPSAQELLLVNASIVSTNVKGAGPSMVDDAEKGGRESFLIASTTSMDKDTVFLMSKMDEMARRIVSLELQLRKGTASVLPSD